MNPLEVAQKRAQEIDQELDRLREQRSAILDKAIGEARDLSDDERKEFRKADKRYEALKDERKMVGDRVEELEEARKREIAAGTARQVNAGAEGQERKEGGAKVTEPPIYRKDNELQTSWLRDLFKANHRHDTEALDRLRRNQAIERDAQKRAGLTVGDTAGGTAGAAGVSGPFAPPAWLVDQYVRLARPARVAADLFDNMPLPSGVSTINIPRVTQGTGVGYQSAELSQLTQQQVKTDSVSSGISTIGGIQLISMQLLEQSAIPFDRVVMEDLALAHAAYLDSQSVNGSGTAPNLRGLASAAGLDTTSATIDATQAVNFTGGPAATGSAKTTNFYSALLLAAAQIHKVRFRNPDTILMHPSRWAWVVAQADSQKRPLVVPDANGPFNSVSSDADYNVAQGRAGRLGGMDVYLDAQLPVAGGTGDQAPVDGGDVAYVFIRNDIKLWESPVQVESFTATYADQAGVLFRLMNYAALIPDRYGSSIVQIRNVGTPGTGTANGLGTLSF